MAGEREGEGMASKIARDVYLMALARLLQAFGVPLAGFMAWQVWSSLERVNTTLARMDTRVAVAEQRAAQADRRLDQLEARAFGINAPTARP